MSNDVAEPKSIPKIRTFAADLESVRESRGDTEETREERELKPIAAKVETPPAKQEEKKPEPKPESKKEEKPAEEKKEEKSKPQIHRPAVSANPPFHQLHKQRRIVVDEDDIEASKRDEKDSLLTDKSKTLTIGGKSSGVDGGTVVTDTKRRRFRLLPSIFSSVTDWFIDFKNRYITKKPPKYTVSGAYRTRGVISSDTVSSGITQIDHKKAIKHIKNRRREGDDEEETTPTPKEGQLLLEAPDAETPVAAPVQPRTNVVVEERKSVATARQKELEAKEAELQQREAALKAAEAEATQLREQAQAEAAQSKEAADALRAEAEAAVAQAQAQRESAESAVAQAQARAAAAAAAVGEVEEEVETEEPDTRPFSERLRDTNVASLLAVVGIAGLVVLYVIGSTVYSLFFAPDTIAPELTVTPLISGAQLQVALPTSDARGAILNTIAGAADNTVEIDLVVTETDSPSLARPDLIAARFGWRVEPAFITSVRQIAFGGYQQTYSFVVLRTTDYETALGGMLRWEQTLANDLTIFRGSGGAAPFTDISVNGIDARESTAAVENQVVWGFINDTTVLIAPNRFVFDKIAPLIR